jgi:hypothetical protein
MKFLIHLPVKSGYASSKTGKPPLVFERSAQHGGRHILFGRELSAEEVNEVADKVFRPKFAPPPQRRPSITVVLDGVAPVFEEETEGGSVETGGEPELTEQEREDWILNRAEEILKRRGVQPNDGEQTETETEPVKDEVADGVNEAEPPAKTKGGRPRKSPTP